MNKRFSRVRKIYQWTERAGNLNLRYVFSGSFWLSGGQVISIISSLIIAIVFAHYLSKETYGTYKYVLSIATIIAAFSYSGLSTSIVQSTAEGSEGALRSGFRQYLKGGAILVGLGFLIGGYYALQGNVVLGIGIFIASLCLPVIGGASLYDSYLQGKQAFKKSTLLNIINIGVPAGLLLICSFFTQSPLPLIITYFVANALIDLLLYGVVAHTIPIKASAGETSSYGFHLSVMNVLTTVSAQIDQLLLFHWNGPRELAIYAYAIAIPEQSKGFIKNIGTLALPKFSANTDTDSRMFMLRRVLILSFATAVPVVIYIVAAAYIFHYLFPAYASSVFYSQIFAISLITGSTVLPLSYLQSKRDTKKLYSITIVTSLVQIALIALGGWLYGLLGVVLGRVIARFFSLFYTVLAAR